MILFSDDGSDSEDIMPLNPVGPGIDHVDYFWDVFSLLVESSHVDITLLLIYCCSQT